MIQNINFSGRETLLTKTAEKVAESPQHKYFSERMIEGAEKVAEKTEKQITADLNAIYKSNFAPYVVKPEPTTVEELKNFTELYKTAHGIL